MSLIARKCSTPEARARVFTYVHAHGSRLAAAAWGGERGRHRGIPSPCRRQSVCMCLRALDETLKETVSVCRNHSLAQGVQKFVNPLFVSHRHRGCPMVNTNQWHIRIPTNSTKPLLLWATAGKDRAAGIRSPTGGSGTPSTLCIYIATGTEAALQCCSTLKLSPPLCRANAAITAGFFSFFEQGLLARPGCLQCVSINRNGADTTHTHK